MKVTFHPHPQAPHQHEHMGALREGLHRHGVETEVGEWNIPATSEVSVIWSWKQMHVISAQQAAGRHILVMERGFMPPRMKWCSLAWDGFNGRGKYAPTADNGQRFNRHFSHLLTSWRSGGEYALLIGQVPGDAALYGLDLDKWARETCAALMHAGHSVRYRPHPVVVRRGIIRCPPHADLSAATLEEDLKGARFCVTYNSTTAVESVLAGVPTYALDEGSIAWPVTVHDLQNPPATFNRKEWCQGMAWRQWTPEELADGTAWGHVRQCILN